MGAGAAVKVAIVGSGPSGFYSAARLLAQSAVDVQVHMYERLPTPHGLVRYGVAPDHPEVKNVENKFAQVAADKRFRFFGNVNIVGSHVEAATRLDSTYTYPLATPLRFSSLLPHYTHVLLSYGSSLSRPLGIPGSGPGQLYNVHPALDFVNWYNGHPAAHDPEHLAAQPWKQVDLAGLQTATVVGAGNVALDVARILLRSTSTLHALFQKDEQVKARAALRETDVPEAVLDQLARSDIREVDIVARRGPAQVAFTNKELREMMDLQGVYYKGIRREDMEIAQRQVEAMERASKEGQGHDALLGEIRVRKRLLSILEKGSKEKRANVDIGWQTSFFQSPRQFLGKGGDEEGSEGSRQVVKAVEWDEMAFHGLPTSDEQQQPWSASSGASAAQLRKTGEVRQTKADLVITSVGYQGAPLDGADPIQTKSGLIPWDAKKGVIPNRAGRVLDDKSQPIPGLYVSGWLATGPMGVIASTRIDANSVVDQMLHDWQQSPQTSTLNSDVQEGEPEALRQSSLPVVSWPKWLRLDAEEVRRGKELGKLREKVLSVREMLEIAG